MGALPDDVMYYIEHRFASRDRAAIYEMLNQEHLTTPRVMRSVLFLADGSLSLLAHNIEVCRTDLATILMNAEFVVGVTEMPMPVRDMSLPFTDEGNLGREMLQPIRVKEAAGPAPGSSSRKAQYHQHLVNEKFVLGKTLYQVCATQRRADKVRCYRREGKSTRVAYLPLVFVLEQLAEHVDIEQVANL